MDWLIGKSKKKDKDIGNEYHENIKTKIPLYLEPNNCTTAFLSVSEIKELVVLPNGLNPSEWIALQTYYVFENLNLLYEVVSVYCTPMTCPTMVGTGNMVYPWFDEKGKKTKLSAPLFIDHVMSNIQKTILDENIFPTKYGNQFSTNFESQIAKIVKWLFQVLSHIYHAHYGHLVNLCGLNSHLNTLFVHLIALSTQLDRLSEKQQLQQFFYQTTPIYSENGSNCVINNNNFESSSCNSNNNNNNTSLNNVFVSSDHQATATIFTEISSLAVTQPPPITVINSTLPSVANVTLPHTLTSNINTLISTTAPLLTSSGTTTTTTPFPILTGTAPHPGSASAVSNASENHQPLEQQVLAPFLTDANPLSELVNLLKIRKNDESSSTNQMTVGMANLTHVTSIPTTRSVSFRNGNNDNNIGCCQQQQQQLPAKSFQPHIPDRRLKEEKRKSGTNPSYVGVGALLNKPPLPSLNNINPNSNNNNSLQNTVPNFS